MEGATLPHQKSTDVLGSRGWVSCGRFLVGGVPAVNSRSTAQIYRVGAGPPGVSPQAPPEGPNADPKNQR
eukprot:8734172-Pyramimonas_sp.AAC.1